MSSASEAASVTLLVADYAVFGPDGKLTVVGGAWGMTQPVVMTPNGPGLPGHYIAAQINTPQKHAGEQIAVTLTLRNASGDPVLQPVPQGESPLPMRVAHLVVLQKPMSPTGAFVAESVPCRVGLAMGIPPGLPLPTGETYRWTLDIDGETHPEWSADFYVLGPPASPVIG